jgi:hypothetical protein
MIYRNLIREGDGGERTDEVSMPHCAGYVTSPPLLMVTAQKLLPSFRRRFSGQVVLKNLHVRNPESLVHLRRCTHLYAGSPPSRR